MPFLDPETAGYDPVKGIYPALSLSCHSRLDLESRGGVVDKGRILHALPYPETAGYDPVKGLFPFPLLRYL